ncbi:Calx-beta domain-containing protein, partial [Candidatus Venteria ishoeyi]
MRVLTLILGLVITVSAFSNEDGLFFPKLSIDKTTLALNTATPTDVVTISNSQSGTLNITNVDLTGTSAGEFEIISDICLGQNITTNSCTITVRFNDPGDSQTREATLEIFSNGGNDTVALSGTGTDSSSTEPVMQLSNLTNFTSSTLTQTLTVTNTGQGTLTDITLTGPSGTNADNFSVPTNNCATASLTNQQTCDIEVTFSDPADGSTRTATLEINSNAGSPQTVTLTGMASGGSTSNPVLHVSDTSLDFSILNPSRVITVTNSATGTLTNITTDPISGASEFSRNDAGCSGKTLAAQETCEILVTFDPPSDTTPRTASLTIHSSNGDETVTLTGTGGSTSNSGLNMSVYRDHVFENDHVLVTLWFSEPADVNRVVELSATPTGEVYFPAGSDVTVPAGQQRVEFTVDARSDNDSGEPHPQPITLTAEYAQESAVATAVINIFDASRPMFGTIAKFQNASMIANSDADGDGNFEAGEYADFLIEILKSNSEYYQKLVIVELQAQVLDSNGKLWFAGVTNNDCTLYISAGDPGDDCSVRLVADDDVPPGNYYLEIQGTGELQETGETDSFYDYVTISVVNNAQPDFSTYLDLGSLVRQPGEEDILDVTVSTFGNGFSTSLPKLQLKLKSLATNTTEVIGEAYPDVWYENQPVIQFPFTAPTETGSYEIWTEINPNDGDRVTESNYSNNSSTIHSIGVNNIPTGIVSVQGLANNEWPLGETKTISWTIDNGVSLTSIPEISLHYGQLGDHVRRLESNYNPELNSYTYEMPLSAVYETTQGKISIEVCNNNQCPILQSDTFKIVNNTDQPLEPWQTPVLYDFINQPEIAGADRALDAVFENTDGSREVIYREWDGYYERIVYRKDLNGSGNWQSPINVEEYQNSPSTYSVDWMRITEARKLSNGDIHLLYTYRYENADGSLDFNKNQIKYVRISNGAVYNKKQVSESDTYSKSANFTVEEDGTVHIVWREYDDEWDTKGLPMGNLGVHYRRGDNNNTWTSITEVVPDKGYNFGIAVKDGNPFVTYEKDDQIHLIYNNGTGWGTPILFDSDPSLDSNPQIFVNEQGGYDMFQRRYAGEYQIYFVRFEFDPITNQVTILDSQQIIHAPEGLSNAVHTYEVKQKEPGKYHVFYIDTRTGQGAFHFYFDASQGQKYFEARANSSLMSIGSDYLFTSAAAGDVVSVYFAGYTGGGENILRNEADYTTLIANLASAPTLEILQPDGTSDVVDATYTITWADEYANGNASISLYYDDDNTGQDGTLIVAGISEDDETDAFTWNTSSLLGGEYYIYGVIDDGVGNQIARYSSGPISKPFNISPVASNPSILGTLEEGQTVMGNYGFADDDFDAESGSTFLWYRADDVVGTNSAEISGATAKMYNLASADVGKYIKFCVTPSDGQDFGLQECSPFSGQVSAVQYTLTASISGQGSISTPADTSQIFCSEPQESGGTDCTESYDENTLVNLQAIVPVPVPGISWVFTHWSDGCAGTTNPTSVAMNADKHCIAHFEQEYLLTVTSDGAGNGTISSSDYYAAGTTVSLTATPDADSVFAGWSPSMCTESFTMPENGLACTAMFNPKQTPGTIQFSPETYEILENGANITIAVTRTGGSSGAASVSYTSESAQNTATSNVDYTIASGALNWIDGDATPKYFTVTITNDSEQEDSELFYVTLGNVNGASLGNITSLPVTIQDDDMSGIYKVGSWGSGNYDNVTISGNYAFVMGGSIGFDIVDISNPATPIRVASYDTTGSVESIAVSDNYVYVADGDTGLQIIDISTISTPVLVSTYDTSGIAGDVAVSGSYAYVADGTHGLLVIDISNPAQPQEAGTYSTYIQTFALRESYIYTLSLGNFLILNIDDPANPVLTANADISVGGNDIVVAGNHAYVAAGSAGLQVVDISNVSTPTLVVNYDTGTANTVDVAGDYVYVGDQNSKFTIVDITNPANPTPISTYGGNYSVLDYVYGLAVSGNYLYIANHRGGLQVVDITTPSASVFVGKYDQSDAAAAVAVSNNNVYLIDYYSGLQVFDANNPVSPILVNSYDVMGNRARGITIEGSYAYIADESRGLLIADISDSLNPIFVGNYATSGSQAVALQNNYAYLANRYSGLFILDITNPANPILEGAYDTAGQANNVAISGDYAYVADYNNGLEVVNITNPSTPVLVANYMPASGYVHDIVIGNNVAYIATSANLEVLDISTPSNPVLVNSYSVSGAYLSVLTLSNNYIYAGGYNGVYAFSIQNPIDLVFAGGYSEPGAVLDIAIHSNYLYLARSGSRFTILQSIGMETESFGILTFDTTTYEVDETGSFIRVYVTRTDGSDGEVSVEYTVTGDTATEGEDYNVNGGSNGTLTWLDGETNNKTLIITVTDDADFEGSETVNLTLSNPSGGASLGTSASATLTITDDDPEPSPGTLQFDATSYEVDETGSFIRIYVTRADGGDGEVSVEYNVTGDTATEGEDYSVNGSSSGILTWVDGETNNKTLIITLTDDTDAEGDETLNLSLSNPSGSAALGTNANATLTINDDEGAALQICSGSSVAIPDNNPSGISDSVVFTDSAAIIGIAVSLNVNHEFVGDLAATLTHEDTGTTVNLINRPGGMFCTGYDIDITLDDSGTLSVQDDCADNTVAYTPSGLYQPAEALSTFSGQNLNGTWTLNVSDHWSGATGMLNNWCVNALTAENTSPLASNIIVSGILTIRKILTGNHSYTDADDNPENGTTYRWQTADDNTGINTTDISGATGTTYTIASNDVDKYLRFCVTPHDGTDAGAEVCSSWHGEVTVASLDINNNDFNADGNPDLLWRNPSTGENRLWLMDDATQADTASIQGLEDSNWQLIGKNDFNADDNPDLLWRNTTTGVNAIWYMDGLNYLSYAYLPEETDQSWHMVATADFNSDGKADIIWRNSTTG